MFLFGAKSKEAETVEFDLSDVYGIIKRTIKKMTYFVVLSIGCSLLRKNMHEKNSNGNKQDLVYK